MLLNSLTEWPEEVARFYIRIYNRCILSIGKIRLLKLRLGISLFFTVALFAFLGLTRPISQTAPAVSARNERARDQQLDLLIIHGRLVDGSGKKPRTTDVGIRGDRIVFVGNARKAHLDAARTIDATGLVVAPGFIDPHTHTLGDLSDSNHKSNLAYLTQGVTTVVTGNDGSSAANIGETLRKWDAQRSE